MCAFEKLGSTYSLAVSLRTLPLHGLRIDTNSSFITVLAMILLHSPGLVSETLPFPYL